MNKSKIQKFAMWARNELIAQVSQRAYQYGIDESGFGDASADTLNGRLLTAEEKSQRQELIKQIREKGYQQVMEEVAYTWFNRFIALRFMEVNNYLPSHIRVFSDASGAFKPEILRDALHLELPGLNHAKVAEYIENNETEALYRYLLLTQCNALNEALPMMFERMGGYTEMLLPNNILRPDSVLARLIADIDEQDWTDQVQIIGWLYQYYNTELKDDTFAQLKKNVKITKERIPAATQLFTPDWIVRYMVENSLGRLWLEGHPNAELHDGWKYYLDEAKQEPEVEDQLAMLREEYKTIKPEEIKVIDPCMGSGHVLVYAFDVLMQIYTSAGWDQREAAQSILKNNLFGLDIDDRAAQLAYFAVMMKARQYDRRLLTRGIQPNIYAIRESNGIPAMAIEYFHKNDPKLKSDIESIVTELHDAKEYGSILNITPIDFAGLYARFDEIRSDISMMKQAALDELLPVVKCAEVLAQKYDVVVTNPPYMGSSGMNPLLTNYVKTNYPDSKSDLFACFIERCGQMAKKNGYQAMITQHAWMFLSSFEKLRTKLLSVDIVNMAHLGARAFEEIGGEVVQTTSFVIRKSHIADYKGEYCRLIEPTTQQGKEDMFLAGENRYEADQSNFSKIPGAPVAYWINAAWFSLFDNYPVMRDTSVLKKGTSTGDNGRFIKQWYEVSNRKIFFDAHNPEEAMTSGQKWFPINGGGERRKWFGNRSDVVNWENDGVEMKALATKLNHGGHWSRYIINPDRFFTESIGWSAISSSKISARYVGFGFAFSSAAMEAFESDLKYLLALINSVVAEDILKLLAPTLNFGVEQIGKIPIKISNREAIEKLANNSINLSSADWDSYETSWDFKRNPLI
jgi:hypothetical protein